MSEEVSVKRGDSALDKIEKLSSGNRYLRTENARLKTELIEAQQATKQASKERDDFASKADESAAIKRVGELETELRGVKHRKIMEKVAAKAGLKPEAVEGFYKLSEYKPDGEPDEGKITAFVETKKAELGYLFSSPADPNAPPPAKPGVGSGQGLPASASQFALQPGDPRLNDASWQMNNYAAIQNAAGERLARGELVGTG